jgi:hemerythrin superfamily protein
MQKAPYKLPTKGGDAVEILMNDHKLIKGLLERLTSAVDNAERKSALEELKAALTIHNATEENLVYPAIERIARKKAEAQHLYHETAEADVVVFELDSMLKEGRGEEDAFAVTAEKLRGAVLEHIEDEEKKAFVHLRDGADEEQTESLTHSVKQFRSALHYEMSA